MAILPDFFEAKMLLVNVRFWGLWTSPSNISCQFLPDPGSLGDVELRHLPTPDRCWVGDLARQYIESEIWRGNSLTSKYFNLDINQYPQVNVDITNWSPFPMVTINGHVSIANCEFIRGYIHRLSIDYLYIQHMNSPFLTLHPPVPRMFVPSPLYRTPRDCARTYGAGRQHGPAQERPRGLRSGWSKLMISGNLRSSYIS